MRRRGGPGRESRSRSPSGLRATRTNSRKSRSGRRTGSATMARRPYPSIFHAIQQDRDSTTSAIESAGDARAGTAEGGDDRSDAVCLTPQLHPPE